MTGGVTLPKSVSDELDRWQREGIIGVEEVRRINLKTGRVRVLSTKYFTKDDAVRASQEDTNE